MSVLLGHEQQGRVILADRFEKPSNPLDAMAAPSGLFGFAFDAKGNRVPVTSDVKAVIGSDLNVLFAKSGLAVSTRRPEQNDAFRLKPGQRITGWVSIGNQEYPLPPAR